MRILLDHAREVSHTSKRVSHTLQRIDALIKEHRGRIQGGRLYALCHHGSLQVSWCAHTHTK